MQLNEGPVSGVMMVTAVAIVVIVAIALIWWSKKTRGGRTAPKK
jgi:hypothetical protein